MLFPRRILVITLAVVCAAVWIHGCRHNGVSMPAPLLSDSEPSTIEYLRGRNLPALAEVRTWENPYGPGAILCTAHYQIFTTLPDPLMLSCLPAFVEAVYRQYSENLPHRVSTNHPLDIYLFKDRPQWEDFTRDFAGDRAPLYTKIKAGAYCHNGACVAYNIGRERTFAVLGHEGWHQFTGRHFTCRLPSWLDEGTATLFEANRFTGGTFVFEPWNNSYRLQSLKRVLQEKRVIPLLDLLELSPGEALLADDSGFLVNCQAQWYALTRFLTEYDNGRYSAGYRGMLAGGLQGTWLIDPALAASAFDRSVSLNLEWNRRAGPAMVTHYIGVDAAALQDQYLDFCLAITRGVRCP